MFAKMYLEVIISNELSDLSSSVTKLWYSLLYLSVLNHVIGMFTAVQSLGDMGDSTIMAALGEIAQPVEVSKKLEHAVDDGNDDTISNDKDETKGNNRDVTIADVVDVGKLR